MLIYTTTLKTGIVINNIDRDMYVDDKRSGSLSYEYEYEYEYSVAP